MPKVRLLFWISETETRHSKAIAKNNYVAATITVSNNPGEDNIGLQIEEDKHYITIYMRGEYVSGEPVIAEPDKFVEVGWFDIDGLPQPRFAPLTNLLAKLKLA